MTTSRELIMVNNWNNSYNNLSCNKAVSNNNRLLTDLVDKGRKDLREDEKSKKDCIIHLREWVKQNPDIENCPTDDLFLLRFLRVKKFSLHMAQQTLLKYLNFKKKFRHFMYNMDCEDPNVSQIIDNGYLFVSPYRDSCGRRVIIYDLSKFDLNKFSGVDMAKVHVITYETLLEDETNQVLGFNHVGNVSGASMNHVPLFTVSDFAYMVRWGEQSIPMRHKEINVLNLPSVIKFVYDFAVSLASEKMKSRVFIHGSLDQLHKRVERECLPLEFGGKMPAKEMIKLWKTEMELKRKRLLSFDDMNLLSDRGIIRRRKPPAQDDTGTGSLPGSFRKLELD
ncbi:unnamed protein product [Psylliodes chrysocephalus]|uniref:CRAL-TRIO domain-containing protein n=1 Tax=Psylliodes chrysocephalus TaxID=3402493 RepID=A0A9P0CA21_9CUCU|nr:unnamed protein product [Psylliodes chrysocephala]